MGLRAKIKKLRGALRRADGASREKRWDEAEKLIRAGLVTQADAERLLGLSPSPADR